VADATARAAAAAAKPRPSAPTGASLRPQGGSARCTGRGHARGDHPPAGSRGAQSVAHCSVKAGGGGDATRAARGGGGGAGEKARRGVVTGALGGAHAAAWQQAAGHPARLVACALPATSVQAARQPRAPCRAPARSIAVPPPPASRATHLSAPTAACPPEARVHDRQGHRRRCPAPQGCRLAAEPRTKAGVQAGAHRADAYTRCK